MRAVILSSLLCFAACGDSDSGSSDTRVDLDVVPLDLSESDASDVTEPDAADADTSDAGQGDTADTAHAETDPVDAADTTSLDTTPLDTTVDTTPLDTADTAVEVRDPVPPCAVITVAEGLSPAPPTTLHLSAKDSTGDAVIWSWTLVSAPNGFIEPLRQATTAEATLEASLAGKYRIALDVRDALGRRACDPAEVELNLVPTAAVHLELIWNDNTDDPNRGADLDLHLLDPDAVGLDLDKDGDKDGYFDSVLDCAWHNPSPTWSADVATPEGPAPVARLLRRDDTGYGPEVIALDHPIPERVYKVGFHVWDDTQTSYLQPTEIRIWIDGVLKNRPNFAVPVHARDVWTVMTVRYPSGLLGFPFDVMKVDRPTSPTK
ncbi:MAG: hypothetical protein JNJ59_06705 [Deltaproteobacteria bacterium]|nr:hypothetical protein [Deltaproteobacteria bacterium]